MSGEAFRTADRYPAFKDGWIVIDARDAPRLANAIGSRIWRQRKAADAFAQRCRNNLARLEAQYIHVVPVDGQNAVFALDFIGADDVIVGANGYIRIGGTK